jgi:hypothetical protein
MKIITITNVEDLEIDNSTIICVQGKFQKSNIQLVLVTSDDIYMKSKSIVKLFRTTLNTNKMYFDSEGTLVDCLKNMESWGIVYTFKNFENFYEWYKTEKGL